MIITSLPKLKLPWHLLLLLLSATIIALSFLTPLNDLYDCGAFHPTCLHHGIQKSLSSHYKSASMPTITIFTAPTPPFSDSPDDPQHQALLSWLRLLPSPKVVLLGADPSFERVSQLYCGKVFVEPAIDYNFKGTPQFHSMFARAQQERGRGITVLINSDIILLQDFMDGLYKAESAQQGWIVFGRHWTLREGSATPVSFVRMKEQGKVHVEMQGGSLNVSAECKDITNLIRSMRSMQIDSEIDYWAWNYIGHAANSPLLTTPMPPFALLRGTYENWVLQYMIKEAKSRSVIDATEAIASLRAISNTSSDRFSGEPGGASTWERYINSHLSNSSTDVRINGRLMRLVPCAEARANNLCMMEEDELRAAASMIYGRKEDIKPTRFEGGQVVSSSSPDNYSDQSGDKQMRTVHPWNHVAGLPETLEQLLPQVADEMGVVVMVGGTSNYKEMLLSFICRAQALGVKKVLVAAFDQALFEYAAMQGLPVYLESTARDYQSLSGNDDPHCIFASECFKHVSKLKSRSVLRVLRSGYSVLWSDIDIVWFRNPLPHLRALLGSATLAIQSDEPDEKLPENNILGANSGFYFVRADEKTVRTFEAIVRHAMGTDTTEQPSFYHVLCGANGERRVGTRECKMDEGGVRTLFLTHGQYPNGHVFGHWKANSPATSCKRKGCFLLHNNYIAGKDKKLTRLVMHGLWFYDVQNRMCLHPWHRLGPSCASPSTYHKYHLKALNITIPS